MIIEIDGARFKRCSRCGILKSVDEYCRDSRSKDSLIIYCKSCRTQKFQDRKKTNRIVKRKEDIEYLPKEKRCSKCGKIKPQSAFHFASDKTDGLASRCNECKTENDLESLYGITIFQYNKILDKQGGVCAICGMTSTENGKSLFVDHNHKTGEIRGLLCSGCNLMLGNAKDDPETLIKAAKYLGGYDG